MQADEVNDAVIVSAAAEPGAATAPVRCSPTETLPPAPEDLVKTCCICGLDVSEQKRSRDRSGRYWCIPCHEFNPNPDNIAGGIPCPDCARGTRPALLIDQDHERICKACHQLYLTECEHQLAYKLRVTADPELEIRRLIRQLLKGIIMLAVASVLFTLYHYHLLYFRPRPWVPFLIALYAFGIAAIASVITIGIQLIRIAIRKSNRRADYDQMVRSATNHVLALEEDTHAMGISETPEPLRRRVERAIIRLQSCAHHGVPHAGEILESLAKRADARPLIVLLLSQRPNTADTVARNREIATISYLQTELKTATFAVNAILLRIPHDQDAMTRQALICYRNGELEQSKKIFRRVVHIAREKNSDADLAAAYCNLGMVHLLLDEFDDAANRYGQASRLYEKLKNEIGQADCMVNLCLIAYRKKATDVETQFRKALAINKHCHRREGMAVCSSLLGVILLEKDMPELKESERLLTHAVQLNLELGRPGGVATAYGNLGLVCVKKRNLPAARELFQKALGIYQRINRPKMAAKIQGMLKTVGNMNAASAARR